MRRKISNLFIPSKRNKGIPSLLSSKSFWAALSLIAFIEVYVLVAPVFLPIFGINTASVLPKVIATLTNEARVENGLSKLNINETLTYAAQAKADDMAEKGYFAHQSPDGSQPWDWISREGYKYSYAGENLAVNFSDSEKVVEAWIDSPTHKLNLMGPRYTEVGIAVSRGMYKGREADFVVQMFATPAQISEPSISSGIEDREEKNHSEIANLDNNSNSGSNQKVLAAQTQTSALPASAESRIVSAPRTYSKYAYLMVAIFFLVILASGALLSKYRHSKAATIRALLIILTILGILFFNSRIAFSPIELPVDNQNAAVVLSAI